MEVTDSTELALVRRGIALAREMGGLLRAAGLLHDFVHDAVGRVPAEPLTRLISSLNDALARRAIELTAGTLPADWCWIALGSEGRQEQTLASDQDNGILFEDGPDADAMRERLLPLALRINKALADCGFPLCRGQVMASNPHWCLSLKEWKACFLDWITESDPQALLNATIFFDLRPLYGRGALADNLSDWLARFAPDNRRFLFQMAENALRRKVPLGVLRDFAVERSGDFAESIDLKVDAATLFVDAARIYGLGCSPRSRNTADRLRLAAQANGLDPGEVRAWIEAFYFIQLLRLKNQKRCHARGLAMHNHVDPNTLDRDDRQGLIHALRQARVLQRRLAMDFLGG
jgi:CBS domain-containing protein